MNHAIDYLWQLIVTSHSISAFSRNIVHNESMTIANTIFKAKKPWWPLIGNWTYNILTTYHHIHNLTLNPNTWVEYLTSAQMSGVPLLTWAGILSQFPRSAGTYQVALSSAAEVRRKKLPRYVPKYGPGPWNSEGEDKPCLLYGTQYLQGGQIGGPIFGTT